MRDYRRARYGLVLCLSIAFAPGKATLADWTGFAQYGAVAEAAIEPGAVEMDIRIREGAIPRLTGIFGTGDIESIASRLLRLKANDGSFVEGRLESLSRPESRGNNTTGAPVEPYYEARLRFLTTGTPGSLSFVPAENTGKELGLVVSHRAVPVADLAVLDAPTRVSLDWDDPWRSRFDDANRIRRHSQPRSFLYVEPYEVRHEVLLRLRDLEPRMNFKPKDPQNLDAGERESLKRTLGDFLRTRNPVRINGTAVEPQLDRVEFLRFGRQGMQKLGDSEPLDPASGLAGVILVYLTEAPAETVDLQWDVFGQGIERRPIMLYFGNESFEFDATRRDPVFHWSADEALGPAPEVEEAEPALPAAADTDTSEVYFRLAGTAAALLAAFLFARRQRYAPGYTAAGFAAAAAVAGALMLYPETLRFIGRSEARAEVFPGPVVQARLQPMLHNVYRAYQLHDEEATYDRLAMSLEGALLEEVYLRQRRSLIARNQGLGGEGRVSRIEVLGDGLKTRNLGPSSFEVSAQWMAHGTVSHWGHAHDRHNLYAARMMLNVAEDGAWKITAMDLLEGRPAASRPAS